MDVIEAIKTRRSDGQVQKETPIAREVIESMLEAGSWAPTHKRTEPWRFAVFSGAGRDKMAEVLQQDLPEKKHEKVEKKLHRAPVIIAVWTAVGRGEFKNPPEWEDHAAVAACCQNMLLAAHAMGYGAIWRSGDYVKSAALAKLLGLDKSMGDRIMAFIYVGHKDDSLPEPLRPDPKWQERTDWFE